MMIQFATGSRLGTFLALVLFVAATAKFGFGQDGSQEAEQRPSAASAAESSPDQETLFKNFSELLSGAKLVGNFTIVGQENNDLSPEEYHIKSVRKLDAKNMWMFTARIKYGGKDVSVPLPLEVQWAGDTPVITMTDFAVPMMGKFSARVVFYNNKYAGTWSSDEHGGHLFGTIVPGAAEEGPKSDSEKKDDR